MVVVTPPWLFQFSILLTKRIQHKINLLHFIGVCVQISYKFIDLTHTIINGILSTRTCSHKHLHRYDKIGQSWCIKCPIRIPRGINTQPPRSFHTPPWSLTSNLGHSSHPTRLSMDTSSPVINLMDRSHNYYDNSWCDTLGLPQCGATLTVIHIIVSNHDIRHLIKAFFSHKNQHGPHK